MTQNDPLVNRLQFKNLSIFKTFYSEHIYNFRLFSKPSPANMI